MRMLISVVSYSLILVLALSASVMGQAATGQNREWAVLAKLKPGSTILVSLENGETLKGKLKNVSEDSLSLFSGGKTLDLEREEVVIVWRVGRSFKKPILIGTAVGAGTGAALGAAVGGCSPRDFLCFERKATIPIGAAVCGLVGALSGLVVGLVRHHEVVVYEASGSLPDR